jgi:broad specificity phosphatase PhoE
VRVLEVRRHVFTKKGAERGRGSHLSQAGVDLARRIGEEAGRFDLVQVRPIPRTMETAIAMGFAVDDVVEALGPEDQDLYQEIGHLERWGWPTPLAEFARLIDLGNQTTTLSQLVHDHFRSMLAQIPEDGRALAISHGRVIECGVLPFSASDTYADWGEPFRHGEGVRVVEHEAGNFAVELLRCPDGGEMVGG